MEESEKRRERLRAMRMEAEADVGSSSNTCSPSQKSTPLSNPLLDRPEDESSGAPTRFGFYTDPMAAFSTHKRPTAHHHPTPNFPPGGPRNAEMPISGVHQFHNSYSPYQNVQQPGDQYHNPGPSTSPMGMRSPYPMHQGNPNFSPAQGRGQWFSNSPIPGSGRGVGPYPMHQGSPKYGTPPQGRGRWSNNSPGPGFGRGGSPSPDMGRGRWSNNSLSPGFGRGGSPSPDMGRGRGRWDANRMSPAPRYSSGGRGRGSGFDGRARSLYDRSMLEDPWESLTPVAWQVVSASGSNLHNRAPFLRTPSEKKPRVSATFDNSGSKQSLAEFLAACADEAVGEATTQ